MTKIEEILKEAKRKAKEANDWADPVADSWLKKFADSPLTPLWMVVILVLIVMAWVMLT